MALRTRMKVCGITVQEDARAAVAAGADGLGFIFVAQSPRVVDPDMVRAITGELPPFVDSIGVFRDEKMANGLDGTNQVPDVLDEARGDWTGC